MNVDVNDRGTWEISLVSTSTFCKPKTIPENKTYLFVFKKIFHRNNH